MKEGKNKIKRSRKFKVYTRRDHDRKQPPFQQKNKQKKYRCRKKEKVKKEKKKNFF